MNIQDKINLQKQHNSVLLFKEGLFLRVYNQSCYILTQLLNQDLKVNCYFVKEINQWVTMCAFPYNKLSSRLQNAELTNFGAYLKGNYDLVNYLDWFNMQCRYAHNVGKTALIRKKDAVASLTRPSQNQLKNNQLIPINILLTQQQIHYLRNKSTSFYDKCIEQELIQHLALALQQNIT